MGRGKDFAEAYARWALGGGALCERGEQQAASLRGSLYIRPWAEERASRKCTWRGEGEGGKWYKGGIYSVIKACLLVPPTLFTARPCLPSFAAHTPACASLPPPPTPPLSSELFRSNGGRLQAYLMARDSVPDEKLVKELQVRCVNGSVGGGSSSGQLQVNVVGC